MNVVESEQELNYCAEIYEELAESTKTQSA